MESKVKTKGKGQGKTVGLPLIIQDLAGNILLVDPKQNIVR
jgi:hypothetical protein